MVTKNRPHTAVLTYVAAGSINSIGIMTEGTITTITIACDIQPNTRRLTIINNDGIEIPYSWDIFCDADSGFSSVPDGANLNFFSKNHIMKQLFEFQHHVEIKC